MKQRIFIAPVLTALQLLTAGANAQEANVPVNGVSQRLSPEDIIKREGQFAFKDGSSFYFFLKDGTFESGPVNGISGQIITGRWRHSNLSDAWVVEGRWSWVNGISPLNDFRRMVIRLSSAEPTGETVVLFPFLSTRQPGPARVYQTYFTIEELVKIAPPAGMASPTPPETLPILQRLSATASSALDSAEWRIEDGRGCVVRLGFAPVPTGSVEPPRPETQVWLLRADGTVIAATRPPDEVGTTFADSKVVSTTRVRIYQYPQSAREEAISVVVRVGDDYFTEQVRR